MFQQLLDFLYFQWIPIWESFLGYVEPHLPEHLHWNEICVRIFFKLIIIFLLFLQKGRLKACTASQLQFVHFLI